MNKNIFIAAPISGFMESTAYDIFREWALKLIASLRFHGFDVYSELESILSVSMYDSPEDSIKRDFDFIKMASVFLIIHPQRMQSSSLVELGYACAYNKNIIIVGSFSNLPYLVKGLPHSNINTKIIDTECIMTEDTIGRIVSILNNMLLEQ